MHEPADVPATDFRVEVVAGGTDPTQVAGLYEAVVARVAGNGQERPAGPEGRPILLPVPADTDPDAAGAEVAARIAATGVRVPADVDVIVQTSGSTTGRGHLVGISADALVASARATAARLSGHGRWLLCLPAHHIAGLQVLVRAALAGHPPRVLDTAGGFRVDAFADAARATLFAAEGAGPGTTDLPCYVSLVPTQLVRVLADDAARTVLSRFAAVLVGGAATSPAALAEARAAGIPVVTTYGMSETGGGCVYDGVPLDGVRVAVEEGTERVLLSGPMLAAGYLDDPAASAQTFRTPSDDPSGAAEGARRVLATSDRGAWDGRRLRVLGRVDDVIITGGIKVDPLAVEGALTALPEVAEACVVGVPDPEWGSAVVAAVVLSSPAPHAEVSPQLLSAEALARLREAVKERLDGAHAPRHALAVRALPTRGPGKTDRRAVAALAEKLIGPDDGTEPWLRDSMAATEH